MVELSEVFQTSLGVLLKIEGKLSDQPDDPGGLTNHGVTQETYDLYRMRLGLAARSVEFIATDEVERVYFYDFWLPCNCDEIAKDFPVLAYELFEFAVNAGPRNASRALQAGYNTIRLKNGSSLEADGIIGPVSLFQIKAFCSKYEDALIAALNVEQYKHYQKVGNPTMVRGWMKRVVVPDAIKKAFAA